MYKKFIVYLLSFMVMTGCVAPDATDQNKVDASGKYHSKTAAQMGKKGGIAGKYKVYGKNYYVMRSGSDYQETGTASWYGPQFNHRVTSSGERFNMYSMTAAHKTLPLATRVQVTNLRNGKSVVVKINDRGPFVGNRLIDLSYGAAKKLGMVNQGTAEVSIKAV